jgi:hypothetical protein
MHVRESILFVAIHVVFIWRSHRIHSALFIVGRYRGDVGKLPDEGRAM